MCYDKTSILNAPKATGLSSYINFIMGIMIIMEKVRFRVKKYVRSHKHCVKRVRIRIFSGPYFPACGLNTKRYKVSLRNQSKCGKIWTKKTPNTDTFHEVKNIN